MEEFLIKLINTLNDVEVKGRDNMSRIVVCISEAEHMLAKIQAENSIGEDGDIVGE